MLLVVLAPRARCARSPRHADRRRRGSVVEQRVGRQVESVEFVSRDGDMRFSRPRPGRFISVTWLLPSSPGSGLPQPANIFLVCPILALTRRVLTHLPRHPFLGTSQSLPPSADRVSLPSSQVANFGLPLAAISDLNKDEEVISGTMTATLAVYSSVSSLLVPQLPD